MVQPLDTKNIAGVSPSERIVREFPLIKTGATFAPILLIGIVLAILIVASSFAEKHRSPSSVLLIVPVIAGLILVLAILFVIMPRYYSQVILTNFRIIITQQKHSIVRRSFSCRDVRLSEIVGSQFQMSKGKFSKTTAILLIMESGEFFDFGSGEQVGVAMGKRGGANPLVKLLFFPYYWLRHIFSHRVIKSSEITDDVYSAVLEAKSEIPHSLV
jgi:hypothetical protein